ncbi:DUF3307 domain-containing protein [Luteolibacter arcticus]|uniref:DUF3307 domain-containing protein n=1 Tax=Luteolibacter arcticus TaxID=1581411 RepID=A0ABT3GFW1_9BACT|nr:DUF3307 domain-containing protein [Luteolibacter arcticus]MCW1922143.1 DUF3307 domain-containing protein [Luteolibacter arcticus]
MSILLQSGPLALFFAFAISHALADFPLQGDYLARTKQRREAKNLSEWLISLTAHSLIHAGGVWIVSGSAIIAVAELVLHWLIDLGKGEGLYGYATDQALHLSCKVIFVIVMVKGWLPV